MPNSPVVYARVPEALESAARGAAPELAALTLSDLVRAGLAMLAGAATPAEAAAAARLSRAPHQRGGGRRRKEHAAVNAEGSAVREPVND